MIDKIIPFFIIGSASLIVIITAIPFFVMGIAIIADLFGFGRDLFNCLEACK